MTAPENRSEPFTSSDEAFFQAGFVAERGPTSERPVTLDAEGAFAEERVPSAARDARRARFVRPVRSTVIALGVMATFGLVRHLWRTDSVELTAHVPALVNAANQAPATVPAAELVVDGLTASDSAEAPLLTASLCDGSSAFTPLGDTPPAEASEPLLFGPPAPPETTPPAQASHRAGVHAKAKPLTRAPSSHAARPARPIRRAAPVTKAALLHALRSS